MNDKEIIIKALENYDDPENEENIQQIIKVLSTKNYNIDEQINKHNQEKFPDKYWGHKEKVVLDIRNDLTGETITITLEGDFKTVKNCRDKILYGYHWHQGSLRREKIEN